MVKGALVERFIQAGQRLLELLDAGGVETTGALWVYNEESKGWRLFLALPEESRSGPLVAYEQIQKVFRPHKEELEPLHFDDIAVKSPTDAPFDSLRRVVKTAPHAVAPRRYSGNATGDYWIDDTWLYRMV